MGKRIKRLTPREDDIIPSHKKFAPIFSENIGGGGDMKAIPSISAKTTIKIAIRIYLFKTESP
ncbi:hypothetical protein ACFLVR_01730 [Chloroflexota bacterium]